MTQIKNNINTYADLTAYNADLNKEYPNISYIQGTDEVKWYKYDPDHIVCVYDVTSTESATKLLGSNNSGFLKQYIDGVEQQSIQRNYTFSTTGEHIVKYISSISIGQNAFDSCSTLTSIAIPNRIKYIGGFAFRFCDNLTKVIIPDIASWCKVVYDNTYYNKPLEDRDLYRDEDTKVTNLTIPNGVTSISANAFYGCKSITSVTIPNSVTSISANAFSGSSLTSVTIPSGVTSMGDRCFGNCRSMTSVTVEATTPPTGTNFFYNSNVIKKIYVPAESVETYKAASGWSDYASLIQAIPNS